MKIKLPTVKSLSTELKRLKSSIEDDMVDWETAREAERFGEKANPSMEITLGSDESGYGLQTGDNSFTGSAYGFRHWGVACLYRNSNCRYLARDLINQCRELAAQ